ncbi:hypothetical protein ACFL1N_15960 [Thermodesulfobacteriota bacterium]
MPDYIKIGENRCKGQVLGSKFQVSGSRFKYQMTEDRGGWDAG